MSEPRKSKKLSTWCFLTEQSIPAKFQKQQVRNTVREVKLGQTELDMQVAGGRGQPAVRGLSIIQMEMYLKDTFVMTRQMGKVATLT